MVDITSVTEGFRENILNIHLKEYWSSILKNVL